MKLALKSAIVLCSVAFSLATSAQMQTRGTWTARPDGKNEQRLNLQIQRADDHGNFGQTYDYSQLSGLNTAAMTGSDQPVEFAIRNDAGTLQFKGKFNKGLGYGEFSFTANPEYIAAMKQIGYGNVEGKAFELAAIDVSRSFAKEIRDLGYNPSLDKLVEARIFRVGREQVEGLKSVGVTDVPLQKLVEFRIFNVTPEYIRQMRASFPNLSIDKMVDMRIHNATPEFAKEMAALGYGDLSADKLVEFRIHGVTPDFIRQMRELGFKDLPADKLVEFRIFNVSADQINELAKEGYRNLSADELVNFRIHGVNANFIEKVKRAGYTHPSPEKLVEYKIMGIRLRDEED